jgi:hypothetical protein
VEACSGYASFPFKDGFRPPIDDAKLMSATVGN